MSKLECSNLDTKTNACYIYECVDSVVGLQANSASPTDTCILSFVEGVKFNYKDVKKGFMKWWINPVT